MIWDDLRAMPPATSEETALIERALRVCYDWNENGEILRLGVLRAIREARAASRGETGIVREPHVDVHCARCDKPVGETAVREGEDVLCLPCSIDDLDGRDLDRSS